MKKSTEDMIAKTVDETLTKYDRKIKQYEVKAKSIEDAIDALDAMTDAYKILVKQRQFYLSEVRHYIKDRASFAVKLTAFFASKKSHSGGGVTIEMVSPSVADVPEIEDDNESEDADS